MEDFTTDNNSLVEKGNSLAGKFMAGVYLWMFFALLVSAVTAVAVLFAPDSILNTPQIFFVLLIVELVLVGILAGRIHRMSTAAATILFLAYATVNGITLGYILAFYTGGMVMKAFLTAAGMFFGMSMVGYITKRDLSRLGSFFLMTLFGLIIASIVNFFFVSSMLDWGISIAGVLIFAGLTAYDTQKMKMLAAEAQETEEFRKYAILAALDLYLDFINIFLFVLRLQDRK